jgi:hypothetical protein
MNEILEIEHNRSRENLTFFIEFFLFWMGRDEWGLKILFFTHIKCTIGIIVFLVMNKTPKYSNIYSVQMCILFSCFRLKMTGSDSDVLEINVDPEEEKKNCEGVLSL